MSKLKVGGKEYLIKYPFWAIRNMERATGMSIKRYIEKLIAAATAGDFSYDDIVILVWGGIQHVQSNVTLDEAARRLEDTANEVGITEIFRICSEALVDSVTSQIKVASDGEGGAGSDEKNSSHQKDETDTGIN